MILIHSALSGDTRTVVEFSGSRAHQHGPQIHLRQLLARPAYAPNVLSPPQPQSPPVCRILRGIRLLKLGLTDGRSEVVAVKDSHIPAIPGDFFPRTKVRLEGKATVLNGMVCLSPKIVTVLGGVVQPLYEDWQMNKKYSGFSPSSLRL
ncbi:hypothetical protein ACFX2I_026190 [Malus domestica]|uniref:uncharacterized protein isoform X2 n=1 Tax=Malus domestica TaxID=3750 RepID=UPI000498C4EF|nr:tudor domain-containing protein 3-like isoform X2 [Malus domestica]